MTLVEALKMTQFAAFFFKVQLALAFLSFANLRIVYSYPILNVLTRLAI